MNTMLIRLSEDGADDERLGSLTGHLSRELRDIDDVDVTAQTGEAPPGTRAVDPVEVGNLVVTLIGTGALQQVVQRIRHWLARGGSHTESRSIRLELDGDTLELTGASTTEQEQLVQLFVLRHVRAPGTT